jgi:hypothetical protein
LSDPDLFVGSGYIDRIRIRPSEDASYQSGKVIFFTSNIFSWGSSYSPRSAKDPGSRSGLSQRSDPDTSNGSDPQTLRSRIKIIRLRNTEIYCMMNFVQCHSVKNVAMSDSRLSDIGLNFSSVRIIRYQTRGL